MSSSAPPAGKTAAVIGGGRWGRIVAGKLERLGFQVAVATDHPAGERDITRERLAAAPPDLIPDLIYVASRSEDHARDFGLVEKLGARVWVEKNFSPPDTALHARFMAGGFGIFNQQLFNPSLDAHAGLLSGARAITIETEVELPVPTAAALFDWIGHDLSLMARILWLRGLAAAGITVTPLSGLGLYAADFAVAGLTFRLIFTTSTQRRRRVSADGAAVLVSGHDGVLRPMDAAAAGDQDTLLTSLEHALGAAPEAVRALTAATLALQAAAFPLL